MRATPPPSTSARGAARAAAVIVLLGAAVGGSLWLWSASEDPPPPPAPADPRTGPMSEEERIAYVKAHVKISDFAIGPDTRPDSDDPVPGLAKVSGAILNAGDRTVDKVVVAIYPKDGAGEVLAAHFEDVVRKGGGLAPGERRPFTFTIPARSGAAEGGVDRELR